MTQATTIISRRDTKYLADWQKKTKNIGDIKVIYVTNNLVDVFYGESWTSHTRIYLDRKGKSFSFTNQEHRGNRSLIATINSILGAL